MAELCAETLTYFFNIAYISRVRIIYSFNIVLISKQKHEIYAKYKINLIEFNYLSPAAIRQLCRCVNLFRGV